MGRVDVRRLPVDWSAQEETLLQAIDDATATPVEIDRRLAEEWFAGIGWILDELEDLAPRRKAVALELAEHLLLRLETALPHVDDSDGGMADTLERLLPLHRRLAGERTQRRLRALGDLELLA
jgi:hypothetical protein